MNGNNVALDKAATQSSTQGDYTAKKAVDGIITRDDSNRQTTDSEKVGKKKKKQTTDSEDVEEKKTNRQRGSASHPKTSVHAPSELGILSRKLPMTKYNILLPKP